MGWLLRCSACSKEMVIEAYHAGRSVPCPWCRGSNEVPREIDFRTLDRAQVKDESRGSWLLIGSVLFFVLFCIGLPFEAWIWWQSNGILARAAEEGRPPDGLVRAARVIAVIACLLQGLSALAFVSSKLF